MSTSIQKRQPAGRPIGGQFAATEHAESAVQLASSPTTSISDPSLEVSNYSYRGELLPEWPESLPAPDVTFEFDDGRPELYVTVEGAGSASFWKSEYGEHFSSFDAETDLWPGVSDEDREQAVEHCNALMDRVEEHVYGITISACTQPSVRKAILGDALGRDREPEPEPTHREQAHRRAEKAMDAAGTSGDPETDLADMLANLRHFADKHGLDFGEQDERAYRYYSDERSDPNFDTAY